MPLSLGVLVGHSGSDVRVALVMLLQDNAFLSLATEEAAANGRLDELIATSIALDQNATNLSDIVAASKDQRSGQQVLNDLRGMNVDLVQYAQGNQDAARRDLDTRGSSLADQLAMGSLSSAAVGSLLHARFGQQLTVADAALAHDESRALHQARSEANDDLARPWAAAIAARQSEQVPPPTEGSDVDLRVAFARQMQERVYLLGWALEAAADHRPAQATAATQADDDNATQLGSLVASAYGLDAGNAYADRLRAESTALLSVANGGDRQQALGMLDRARGDLDSIISGANFILPRGLLTDEYRAVDQSLLAASDALVAHDYATAYTRVREAARLSQKGADSLSEAIVDRYPGRFLVAPTPPAS